MDIPKDFTPFVQGRRIGIRLEDKTIVTGNIVNTNSGKLILNNISIKPAVEAANWKEIEGSQEFPWGAIVGQITLINSENDKPDKKPKIPEKIKKLGKLSDRIDTIIGAHFARVYDDADAIESLTKALVTKITNDDEIKKLITGESE